MALIFKAMLAQNETRGAIMKLDGRIAVVSGAFRGIGKASAEILATEGAHVIALDIIDGEPVYASPRIAYRRFDVASPQMWDDLAKELERIDILVNSAGITQTRSGLTDLDLSEWNRIIAVNQTGTLLGMRMAVSLMLGKGACSIVNISSIWGYVAGTGQLAYHASKGAASIMTRNAAITYAKQKIRVNAILPGLIETEMVRDQPPEMRKSIIDATPMGRVGAPEEVAKAVLYLVSDDSSYVTGVLLPVDGGFTAQ
jgi:NAD(P)-dependent dehydrogenase (short-subunit alcohol dehydrogenase family)